MTDINVDEVRAYQNEEKRKLAAASEEKLKDPLWIKFFEEQDEATWRAFKELPLGATLGEYQTIHHRTLALQELVVRLNGYIREHEIALHTDGLLEREVV